MNNLLLLFHHQKLKSTAFVYQVEYVLNGVRRVMVVSTQCCYDVDISQIILRGAVVPLNQVQH